MRVHRTGPSFASAPPYEERSDATLARPTGVVELGWLVVGSLDEVDRAAIRVAHGAIERDLQHWFPDFDWRVPFVERADLPRPLREEPVDLLEVGVEERDARRWDFVLVITAADLITRSVRDALGTPSHALGVGIVSTARIDPRAQGVTEVEPSARAEVIARRLRSLAAHVFARVAGLDRDELPNAGYVEALDGPFELPGPLHARLDARLREVADARVEEARPQLGALAHYIAAVWVNRGAIVRAIRRARPWRFPLQFGKLSTAVASALLVLMNTAEVWEVAVAQALPRAVGLALFVLVGTTVYVVHKQRLHTRQRHARTTEQRVVGDATLKAAVALGMLATYVQVFVFALAFAWVVYPSDVIVHWTNVQEVAIAHFVRLASFVASTSIVIGALGASFEQQRYFRHVVYVDDDG